MKVGTDGVLLGAWADMGKAGRILDVGTGTGLLALIAAQRAPDALVDAVEVDAPSAAQAEENFRSSPWAGRLSVKVMDARYLSGPPRYDALICNPPFHSERVLAPDPRRRTARSTAAFDPSELLALTDKVLLPTGALFGILPVRLAQGFLDEAATFGLLPQQLCEVRYRPDGPVERTLFHLVRRPRVQVRTRLTVEDMAPRTYSAAFRTLTHDLYPPLR